MPSPRSDMIRRSPASMPPPLCYGGLESACANLKEEDDIVHGVAPRTHCPPVRRHWHWHSERPLLMHPPAARSRARRDRSRLPAPRRYDRASGVVAGGRRPRTLRSCRMAPGMAGKERRWEGMEGRTPDGVLARGGQSTGYRGLALRRGAETRSASGCVGVPEGQLCAGVIRKTSAVKHYAALCRHTFLGNCSIESGVLRGVSLSVQPE
ncbi:hypothetical protein C8J57DRAFT_1218535 [Mycena rebaudengoi]|nr:hypothetical protein C8J57DRAFT_1218535 [Mycena rebaudengoi]